MGECGAGQGGNGTALARQRLIRGVHGLSWKDTRTFLLAGGVAIGAYVLGMAALSTTGVRLDAGSVTFGAGFLVFMAVYFASMAVSGRFE